MRKQSYFTKIRRYRLKKKAVDLMGNKCNRCQWSGHIAGFAFHHIDPASKLFTVSNYPSTNWDIYWKEIQKCELLCATCHSIHHSDYNDEQFLKDVENYNGRDLDIPNQNWKNQHGTPASKVRNCNCCNIEFTGKYIYYRRDSSRIGLVS